MTLADEVERTAEIIGQWLVGLFFMALGVIYLAWEKTHPPTHDVHLLGGLFVSLFGAACLPVGARVIKALMAVIDAFARLVAAIVQLLARQVPPKDGAP